MTQDKRTELQQMLDSLCVAVKRDGACITGKAVERILDAARNEVRAELQPRLDLASARLDLASEFRIPRADGLGVIAVVRESVDSDQFAVTDGYVSGLCAWVDGEWQTVWDIGRERAFCYGLDEALRVAGAVAEHEAKALAAAGGGA